MVRVQIKGGVWKNTEDEILKAAISKYGMNQWARISSLLVRKTPKQCKARWYEWLDPNIKKTEWSKEEDEKLLHLAKLMPTQWRTIAPIVGRTATQCLERYQRLLDEAEEQDREAGDEAGPSKLGLTGVSGPEAAPSADDVRRLRPGEVDPDPESKPARPDPIDMDEDEKEMLSEARARLANTQGKKAKRKARERALEEARRLAMLQKRRELKAAGIVMRGPKNKKGGVDYNADIPFEKQPALGFYDTTEEDAKSYQAPVGKTLGDNAERKRKPDSDSDARKKKEGDAAKKSDPFGERAEQLRKMREADSISKRRKLTLPEAQVDERELENIVKLGQAGEQAREMVSGSEATQGLLTDFDALSKAKTARTPRTAPEEDAILREARNLKSITAAQTPLLGDANTPLEEALGNLGARPLSSAVQTPNPLATPIRPELDNRVDSTPRSERSLARTPMQTPRRDELGLNDASSSFSGTPFDNRRAQLSAKQELLSGLRSLPRPKNDFELVLDDEEEEDDDDDGEDYITISEDAADRDARVLQQREEERRKALARRSQVVQLDLPRPANVDSEAMLASLRPEHAKSTSQRLIMEEMIQLIKHDSVAHPIAGSKATGSERSSLSILSDDAIESARDLIRSEMGRTIGFPGANEVILRKLVVSRLEPHDEDETEEEAKERTAEICAIDNTLKEALSSTAWSAKAQAWVAREDLSEKAYRAGQTDLLQHARRRMGEAASDASREEKKLAKLLGGYQARSQTLSTSIKEAAERLSQAGVESLAYERLALGEGVGAKERTEKLEAEVRSLESKELLGQARYKELDDQRRLLRARIEALRGERDMLEAEKLNEAALANDTADEE